jgi:hypothetical protein
MVPPPLGKAGDPLKARPYPLLHLNSQRIQSAIPGDGHRGIFTEDRNQIPLLYSWGESGVH